MRELFRRTDSPFGGNLAVSERHVQNNTCPLERVDQWRALESVRQSAGLKLPLNLRFVPQTRKFTLQPAHWCGGFFLPYFFYCLPAHRDLPCFSQELHNNYNRRTCACFLIPKSSHSLIIRAHNTMSSLPSESHLQEEKKISSFTKLHKLGSFLSRRARRYSINSNQSHSAEYESLNASPRTTKGRIKNKENIFSTEHPSLISNPRPLTYLVTVRHASSFLKFINCSCFFFDPQDEANNEYSLVLDRKGITVMNLNQQMVLRIPWFYVKSYEKHKKGHKIAICFQKKKNGMLVLRRKEFLSDEVPCLGQYLFSWNIGGEGAELRLSSSI